jgi:DNA-binding NarL/FixJ family response regulator
MNSASEFQEEVWMNETIRVLLVDDCSVLRMGLRRLFQEVPDIRVVGETGNGNQALLQIKSLQPDVTLLDCRLPEMEGTEVATAVRQGGLVTNILALSAYYEPEYVRGMLEAGVVGYVLKDEAPEKIVEAVRAAACGQEWFSPPIAAQMASWARQRQSNLPALTGRETAVLRLLARGKSNKQIADALCLTERTVRFHMRNVCDKIGADSDRAAAVWAIQHGFGGEERDLPKR